MSLSTPRTPYERYRAGGVGIIANLVGIALVSHVVLSSIRTMLITGGVVLVGAGIVYFAWIMLQAGLVGAYIGYLYGITVALATQVPVDSLVMVQVLVAVLGLGIVTFTSTTWRYGTATVAGVAAVTGGVTAYAGLLLA